LINSGAWFALFESPHIHHRRAAKPRQRDPGHAMCRCSASSGHLVEAALGAQGCVGKLHAVRGDVNPRLRAGCWHLARRGRQTSVKERGAPVVSSQWPVVAVRRRVSEVEPPTCKPWLMGGKHHHGFIIAAAHRESRHKWQAGGRSGFFAFCVGVPPLSSAGLTRRLLWALGVQKPVPAPS
jgi:hypothetical protein